MTARPTFAAYDYLTVHAPRDLESLHVDTYRNLGWELEVRSVDQRRSTSVTLKFKRDRDIPHRSQVMELQRRCVASLQTIGGLERSKSSAATQASLTLGIVGSAFLAVAVFAITDWDAPALTVIAGAIGLIGWAFGYFSHDRIRARQTDKVAPLIEEQYQVVYDASKEAADLLASA